MKSLFICLILAAATNCVAQNVGIGTTTPVARLHVADSAVLFTGPSIVPLTTTYYPPIQGAGTRMMWYPQKAAFRVGYTNGDSWDFNKIGKYSFATSSSTTASGYVSTAMGNFTEASGDYSTALGTQSIASGFISFATGFDTKATGNYSTAMGAQSVASGLTSFAIGPFSTASGGNSTAIGNYAMASQDFATAIGRQATASNFSSVALGEKDTASGAFSVSMGILTKALGESSFTVGNNTVAKASGSFTTGRYNDISDNPDNNNLDPADRIFQIGNGNETSRSNAVTLLRNGNMGIGTTTPKVKLHVVNGVPLIDPYLGSTMAIQSDGETTLQILSGNNIDYGGSIVFGHNLQNISAGIQFNTFATNELSFYTNASLPTFTINNVGNIGIHTVGPKAAFNVGADKTALFGADTSGAGSKMIWYPSKSAFRAGYAFGNNWDFNNVGMNSFATGIATLASGENSTAMGALNSASGYSSTAIGALNTASGDYSTAIGSWTTAKSYNEISIGSYNTDYTPLSVSGWNSTDRLFTIGNGASSVSRSNALVILKNGNAGIGTSSPTEKLEVAGKIKTTDLQITNGAAIGKILSSDASGNASWVTPATIPANYWTVSGNNIYNNNTGNIGIGTNAPSNARMVISGVAGQEGLDLSSTDQYANLRVIRNSLGSDKDMYIGLGSGAVSSLHLYSNNVETITLKAGNAGIGISSPNAPLQFATSNQKRKIVLFETANNDNQFFGFGVFAGELRYQTGVATDDHVFYTAASSSASNELMRIKGNGNAGIGTATPASKLEVNGALATKVTYYGSGSGNVTLDNSATVWIFAINGFSVSLPDPTASANRRYTIVNKTNVILTCSGFYNMANVLTTSIPAFSSIEVIGSNNTNRWEQIK